MYTRVVSAIMESQAISTVDDPLIEVSVPANVVADILRIEIGPAEGTDPVAEVQELMFYSATGAGTGGTAITEALLNGAGTISCSALRNLTAPGTGLVEWFSTAFNTRAGYYYLPVPEERYRSKAGDQDYFGFYFPTVPDQAMTFSATIVWGEIG